MRTLLALLLLAANVGAQDFNWALDDPFSWSITEKGGDPDLRGTDVTSSGDGQESETPPSPESFVHRINVVNRGGSATCIGPGVYVTCKHLFEGLRGYQVSIDGQAVAASVTMAPSHDVAVVVIGDEASAASESASGRFSLSAPEFMAEHLAFGYGSETLHTGLVSNDDVLSLTSEAGIQQGDSGGGVFANGTLVGVIRGKNPANPRVCYFTPLKDVAALVAPFSPDAVPPADPGAESKPKLRINIADFPCPPCETLKGYSWDEFDVEWVTGGAPSFPQISWLDSRGVRRVLTGAYTPSRVKWSYDRTVE